MPGNNFEPKEPLTRLSLAARKNVRDEYESKKADFEQQIADQLGISQFTLDLDILSILSYATEDAYGRAGSILQEYITEFISGLEHFVATYSDEGKSDFNKAVTQSKLVIEVNPLGMDADGYISGDIQDGVFRILFKCDSFGYNTNYMNKTAILNAVDAANDGNGFSLRAKDSIEQGWNSKIDGLRQEIADMVNIPNLVLDPNFEENYEKLKAARQDPGWQEYFGTATFEYFNDGFKYQLEQQGFNNDDLLKEGLAEALTSNTVKLRIVEQTSYGGYGNEPFLEEGILYLQTTEDYWQMNVPYIAHKLTEIL